MYVPVRICICVRAQLRYTLRLQFLAWFAYRYVHWDWVGDWGSKSLLPGAGALSYLKEMAKAADWSGLDVSLASTVPALDVIAPWNLPPLVGSAGSSLAVIKPTSALIDEVEDGWPGTWERHVPVANITQSLLALKPGTITYVYKIWDVPVSGYLNSNFAVVRCASHTSNLPPHIHVCIHARMNVQFTEVEELGVALLGSHVQLVDYRTMHNLTRGKEALYGHGI